jgi:hypothetical protein
MNKQSDHSQCIYKGEYSSVLSPTAIRLLIWFEETYTGTSIARFIESPYLFPWTIEKFRDNNHHLSSNEDFFNNMVRQIESYSKKQKEKVLMPPEKEAKEPETIKEWLETLPDGYRELALKNFNRDNIKADCLSYAIMNAFTWKEAEEGGDFWRGVHNHFVNTKNELPPIKKTSVYCDSMPSCEDTLFISDSDSTVSKFKHEEIKGLGYTIRYLLTQPTNKTMDITQQPVKHITLVNDENIESMSANRCMDHLRTNKAAIDDLLSLGINSRTITVRISEIEVANELLITRLDSFTPLPAKKSTKG